MLADGVYEVVRYYNGRPIAMDRHVQRMAQSLAEIRISFPGGLPPFDRISDQIVQRNNVPDAALYWQVTRGVAPRTHGFPSKPVAPTVLVMAYPEHSFKQNPPNPPSLKAITQQDIRWPNCYVKSISLLPNVLMRQAAQEAGCDDAILLRGDIVAEATSRTIAIIEGGVFLTHPLDGRILPSITREIILELARTLKIPVREDYYNLHRLMKSSEVMALGTSTEVAAITHVDGKAIGEGAPGPITRKLTEAYREFVRAECVIQ